MVAKILTYFGKKYAIGQIFFVAIVQILGKNLGYLVTLVPLEASKLLLF